MRWQPAVRTLPPYHDDPAYIDALADVAGGGARRAAPSSRRWCSPPSTACRATISTRATPITAIARRRRGSCASSSAGRRRGSASSSSRASARAEWLQPYIDVTIAELAKSGIKRLAVVMPGFSADCLETLEEIAHPRRGDLPRERRRPIRRGPLPQRQRRRHGADRNAGAARAFRLARGPVTAARR